MSSIDSQPARPRPLSDRGGTIFGVAGLITSLAASSAPTPLYRLYQEGWGLSPALLTVIFAAYALSLLAALLTVGSLSDYVGRRPVIFVSLLVNALAMVLFIRAESAATLILARALQGFATGVATSTLGAVILDSNRTQGALINSIAPFLGTALGALGSSLLVTFAPAPLQLVYILLLAAFLLQALLVWPLRETAVARPGALASLRPQMAVPPQARRALLLVTPVNIAVWALGGFYLSLMPSLLRVATGLTSPFVGGSIVATLTLTGAIAILITRPWPSRRILMTGTAALVVGVAVILAGVHSQAVPLLLAGTVIGGWGFGTAFFGAARTVLPLAAPHERAGLLAAFYAESYLAFSLPAILVGLAAPGLGLVMATYLYGAVVILLAVTSLVATAISLRPAT